MPTSRSTKYVPTAANGRKPSLASTCLGWCALHQGYRRFPGEATCGASSGYIGEKRVRELDVMHTPGFAAAGRPLAAEPRQASTAFETDHLDRRCVDRLIAREALVARVAGFVPRSLALDIGGQLIDHMPRKGFEDEAPMRLGMSFDEVLAQPERFDDYFEQAPAGIEMVRKCCAPYLSPVDLLRSMLDELWPAGAQLQAVGNRKMFIGLPNVLPPEVCLHTRCNTRNLSALALPAHGELQRLLVCNIHLTTALNGGSELQIWNEQALSADVRAMLRAGDQEIDPDLLGEPALTIRPEPGELILFDARHPYAISDPTGVPRMNLSCFIGYRGEDAPLTYWS